MYDHEYRMKNRQYNHHICLVYKETEQHTICQKVYKEGYCQKSKNK